MNNECITQKFKLLLFYFRMRISQKIASNMVEHIITQLMAKINKIEIMSKNKLGTWCSNFLSGFLQSQAHQNDAGLTSIDQCPQTNLTSNIKYQTKIIRSKSVPIKQQKSGNFIFKHTMKVIPSSKTIDLKQQKQNNQQRIQRFIKLNTFHTEKLIDIKNYVKQQVHFNCVDNRKLIINQNASLSQIKSKRSIRTAIDSKQNKKQLKQFMGGVMLNYHIGSQRKAKSKFHFPTTKVISIVNQNIKPERSKTALSPQITFRKKCSNLKKNQKQYLVKNYKFVLSQNQAAKKPRPAHPICLSLKSKNTIHVYNLKRTMQLFPPANKEKEIQFPRKNLRL